MEEIKANIELVIFGTLFLVIFMTGFFVFLFFYIKRFYRFELEKNKLQQESETLLATVQQEIQEETLQHVSRELHDNLGQLASLIKINLNTIQSSEPEVVEKVDQGKDLIRNLIRAIKSLSVSLGSDGVEQLGLINALQQDVNRINTLNQITIDFQSPTQVISLPPEKSIVLYRMSQEIINNALKHSAAKHLDIHSDLKGNLFTLAFTDDGNGFDVEERMKSGGAGLRNLTHRAKTLGASIQFNSKPGNGTSVVIDLLV